MFITRKHRTEIKYAKEIQLILITCMINVLINKFLHSKSWFSFNFWSCKVILSELLFVFVFFVLVLFRKGK